MVTFLDGAGPGGRISRIPVTSVRGRALVWGERWEELIMTSGFASSGGGRWERFCMGDAGGGAFMTLAFRPQE